MKKCLHINGNLRYNESIKENKTAKEFVMILASIATGALKTFMILMFGFYPPMAKDVEERLQELKVNHEIVKEIPDAPDGARAYYDGKGKIWFDEDYFTGGGTRPGYYATHEFIHMIRHQAGINLSRRIEEAVAVYGAEEIAKEGLKLPCIRVNEKRWYRETLYVNRLPEEHLNKSEMKLVEEEIQKTLELVKAYVKEVKE